MLGRAWTDTGARAKGPKGGRRPGWQWFFLKGNADFFEKIWFGRVGILFFRTSFCEAADFGGLKKNHLDGVTDLLMASGNITQ